MIKVTIKPVHIKPGKDGHANETLSSAVTILDAPSEDIQALFNRYHTLYGRCRGSFSRCEDNGRIIDVGWVFTHKTFVTRDDWHTDVWIELRNTTPEQNQAVLATLPNPPR